MIQKVPYLYEILYRGGPEGFRAAHQWLAVAVVDDETGEVYDDGVGKSLPSPITTEEAAALLGAQVASLLAANATLTAEKAQALHDNEVLQGRVDTAEEAVANLTNVVASYEAT